MFNWFKKKQAKLDPIDFSNIKVDIHSHLIPGIDDGAKSVEDSLALIKELVKYGYKKIITTPHVMSDLYKNDSTTIISGLEKIRKRLKEESIDIEFEAAAEYYVDYDFEQRIGKENFLTFGDNYLLIEFSFLEAPRNLYDIIFKLQLEGYKLVLAHPARYQYLSLKDYEGLIDRGVLFQLNFLSMLGYYSNEVKNNAEMLIKKEMISFVGTDCHNMNHARLYSKCQTLSAWHDLVKSQKLLNSQL